MIFLHVTVTWRDTHGNRRAGGRHREQEELKERGKRKGGRGGRGRGENQANNKRSETYKYKEQNGEGIASTVIIQSHPERGGA